MTLPASGAISMSQVNTELGQSSTAAISLGDTAVRNLFGVASGAISMSNGYGKSSLQTFSFAGGTNIDLRTQALAQGWNGSAQLVMTNTGTITSNSTGSAALTISGSFPSGVTFVNSGQIYGRGGDGGKGGDGGRAFAYAGVAGGGGGTAIAVSTYVSITNNGTIAGGGGGGGGAGAVAAYNARGSTYSVSSGGGGGGGIGNSSGGAAGAASSGGTIVVSGTAGGGGTLSGAGGRGASGNGAYNFAYWYAGNGGGWGSSGATGQNFTSAGNTVASGTLYGAGGSGGGAGSCTSGNSYITWLATGTRYGPLN